ncbi:flagellar biosynthesis repressor FlbT [Marivita sp. S6314]|uniref:flagellar biosynthesis repressor FlbT n=1 Tax=Marivita sp. S6314 TaxID=2926406 RepID=UPI001FF324A1|nr:flagellar biosynthesis repressor FlbT [Marivita sp. S6314]MCK0151416.1 flagellar biosynthesis repressor FlbT [Marivita sp. S6314]
MSGLVLKLAPRERVLINGAVIENGERRSKITIVNQHAKILRLKDAIHPSDVNTPVKQACYLAQLLLSGEVDSPAVTSRLREQINVLRRVFERTSYVQAVDKAGSSIDDGNIYLGLKALRGLLAIERSLLKQA